MMMMINFPMVRAGEANIFRTKSLSHQGFVGVLFVCFVCCCFFPLNLGSTWLISIFLTTVQKKSFAFFLISFFLWSEICEPAVPRQRKQRKTRTRSLSISIKKAETTRTVQARQGSECSKIAVNCSSLLLPLLHFSPRGPFSLSSVVHFWNFFVCVWIFSPLIIANKNRY